MCGYFFRCTNECGELHPELNTTLRSATQDEENRLMEHFANNIRALWGLGSCENDVLVFYCQQLNKVKNVTFCLTQGGSDVNTTPSGPHPPTHTHNTLLSDTSWLILVYNHFVHVPIIADASSESTIKVKPKNCMADVTLIISVMFDCKFVKLLTWSCCGIYVILK